MSYEVNVFDGFKVPGDSLFALSVGLYARPGTVYFQDGEVHWQEKSLSYVVGEYLRAAFDWVSFHTFGVFSSVDQFFSLPVVAAYEVSDVAEASIDFLKQKRAAQEALLVKRQQELEKLESDSQSNSDLKDALEHKLRIIESKLQGGKGEQEEFVREEVGSMKFKSIWGLNDAGNVTTEEELEGLKSLGVTLLKEVCEDEAKYAREKTELIGLIDQLVRELLATEERLFGLSQSEARC